MDKKIIVSIIVTIFEYKKILLKKFLINLNSLFKKNQSYSKKILLEYIIINNKKIQPCRMNI